MSDLLFGVKDVSEHPDLLAFANGAAAMLGPGSSLDAVRPTSTLHHTSSVLSLMHIHLVISARES